MDTPRPAPLPAAQVLIGDLLIGLHRDPEQVAVAVLSVTKLTGNATAPDVERAAVLLELHDPTHTIELVRGEGVIRFMFLPGDARFPLPAWAPLGGGDLRPVRPLLAYLAAGVGL